LDYISVAESVSASSGDPLQPGPRPRKLPNLVNYHKILAIMPFKVIQGQGSPGTISVKFLPKGHRWPRYQMA